ncbi:MAG: hypothetical protein IKR86_05865 [Candidatus Methanomethylophilaceae archaeon]|nr:hypothetical protein [Candidatus Methanomethylophilaceae archaeon]
MSEKSLRSFWKAYKAGDPEKCESICSGCSEDGSFEGLVLRLSACMELKK